MKKEEFLNKRNSLLTDAQNLLNDGKAEESNAKMAEVEVLDKAYDEEIKAQANLNRLQNSNNAMTNPFDKSDKVIAHENKIKYEDVFAKFIKGEVLNSSERDIFKSKNAVTTNGNTAVIPKTISKEIIKEIGETHAVLKDFTELHVKGFLSLVVGTVTSNVDFYDEDNETTKGTANTNTIDFNAYELKVHVPVTFKTKEMTTAEFLEFIKSEIVEQAGNKLANAVINGKGVATSSDNFKSQPTGILKVLNSETNTPRVITYSGNDTSDTKDVKLRKMLGMIKSGYKGKKFYANNTTIWNDIAGIKDTTGKSLFVPDATGTFAGRIYGVPVAEEDAMADGDILLGDMKRGYVMNFNKDMTLSQQDRNKDAQTDYTLYGLVDGKVKMKEAFAYLKKS